MTNPTRPVPDPAQPVPDASRGVTEVGRVGLVLVSHSAQLAAGLAELAGQMAPDVAIHPAGGGPDGGLGTDFDAISGALAAADSGRGVLLLYDLGSAQLTAEIAVEALPEPDRALLVDAPLVEGAVAAAVAAQGGAELTAVAAVARAAAGPPPDPDPPAADPDRPESAAGPDPAASAAGPAETAELELTNEIGLHARPAAQLARALTGLDAHVTVALGERTADARSVLAVLGLAATKGDRITINATGPQSAEAVAAIRTLIHSNFAE